MTNSADAGILYAPEGALALGDLLHSEAQRWGLADQGDAPALLRRRARRRRYHAEIHFEDGEALYSGVTTNISRGGLFIATTRLLAECAQVTVHFPLPTSVALITADAEVRWGRDYDPRSDRPPGMGMKFTAMGPDAQRALERFVAGCATVAGGA